MAAPDQNLDALLRGSGGTRHCGYYIPVERKQCVAYLDGPTPSEEDYEGPIRINPLDSKIIKRYVKDLRKLSKPQFNKFFKYVRDVFPPDTRLQDLNILEFNEAYNAAKSKAPKVKIVKAPPMVIREEHVHPPSNMLRRRRPPAPVDELLAPQTIPEAPPLNLAPPPIRFVRRPRGQPMEASGLYWGPNDNEMEGGELVGGCDCCGGTGLVRYCTKHKGKTHCTDYTRLTKSRMKQGGIRKTGPGISYCTKKGRITKCKRYVPVKGRALVAGELVGGGEEDESDEDEMEGRGFESEESEESESDMEGGGRPRVKVLRCKKVCKKVTLKKRSPAQIKAQNLLAKRSKAFAKAKKHDESLTRSEFFEQFHKE
jgi:hypothetical protein